MTNQADRQIIGELLSTFAAVFIQAEQAQLADSAAAVARHRRVAEQNLQVAAKLLNHLNRIAAVSRRDVRTMREKLEASGAAATGSSNVGLVDVAPLALEGVASGS